MQPSPEEESFDDAAFDAFLDALEKGAAPSVEAFLEAWPNVSAELEARLLALHSKLGAGARRPALIGGMRVTAVLGQGGMGEVFAAHDDALDREVAIKVLLAPLAHQPRRIERLRMEARTLAALNHPNVATVYGLGGGRDDEAHSGEPIHIVMELIQGRDLARALREGALPFREAFDVLAQIAAALAAAHERRILHRDLKPSNVMLRPDGVVKVLDFGLSSRSSDEGDGVGRGRPSEGTPGYMSPEQRRGDPQDERTDVWAFGRLAFEVVTGRRGGVGAGGCEVSELPRPFAELLERCLAEDCDQRPANGRTVLEELESMRELARPSAPGPEPLPMRRTSFHDSASQSEGLRAVLGREPGESRLVTVVGPAGVGKTRLALEAAEALGGAYLIELAGANDGSVERTILRALGLQEELSEEDVRPLHERATGRFSPRGHPLIFDNCEHVIDAVRRILTPWLAADPDLLALATSREPLGHPDEIVFRIAPLDCAGPSSDAMKLFVQTARAAGCVEFSASGGEARARERAASICARLDGLPLGIELAAARAAEIGLAALGERLSSLASTPEAGPGAGPEAGPEVGASGGASAGRHDSLAAAIRWSVNLLDPADRRFFGWLSTFSRGWTLETLEALVEQLDQSGDGAEIDPTTVLERLARLTRRSLVTRGSVGERWRLLQTVHDFGRAELALDPEEERRARTAHALAHLDVGQRAVEASFGARRRAAFANLEASLDDFLAAAKFSASIPALAKRYACVCAELFEFWLSRGFLRLGEDTLRETLAHAEPLDDVELAQSHLTLGTVAQRRGHPVRARAELDSALRFATRSSDRAMLAKVMRNQGYFALIEGDAASAERDLERALLLESELSNLLRMATLHNDLGLLRVQQGRLAEAAEAYERGLRLRDEVGCQWGIASSLGNLGEVHHQLGRHASARLYLERSLAAFEQLGDVRSLAESFELFAALELASEAEEGRAKAARLLGSAGALRLQLGFPKPQAERARLDDLHAELEARLGAEALVQLLRSGEQMSVAETVALAAPSPSA